MKNTIKKMMVMVMALVMVVSMVACTNTTNTDTNSVPNTEVVETEATVVTETSKVETEEATEADKAEEIEASGEAEEVEETETVEVEETKAEEVTPAPTKEPETEKAEPVHTHSYTSRVTKEATCDTNGTKTYECSCGDSYTEAIQATGHTYDNGKVVKEATCTEAGGKVFTCTKCGAVYTEAISAHGHNPVTTEATGHIEQVQVGTEKVLVSTQKREYSQCCKCGYIAYTNAEVYAHNDPASPTFSEDCWNSRNMIYTEYVPVYEEQPKYENRWVEDTPATTICSECGQRQ